MITIYTRTNNIFKKEFWKWFLKKVFRKYSGPDAVLDSLKRGLTELNIPFEINPFLPAKYQNIHVLSGVDILNKMIRKKSKGKIKNLIVGPTMTITPDDYNGILLDKNIDLILFPSEWTKDFYVSIKPELKDKIQIWPAGVKIPKDISTKENILIFKKNIDENQYNQIIKILNNKGIIYDIIEYGKYRKDDYIERLKKAKLLIYLQKTESQGLALQEAWSYDVPTFVIKNTLWQYNQYSWDDDKMSAPYLTRESGVFFDTDNLDNILDEFINNKMSFLPRKYCIDNLSDIVTTNIYINTIKKYAK